VFERVLAQMRAKVRAREYVLTTHAEDEMDADGLSIFDVESAVLTGVIVERQVDQGSRERKYVVRGRPLEGSGSVGVVAKIGPTGQLVVLTVYIW
jgi:hypothetical protein